MVTYKNTKLFGLIMAAVFLVILIMSSCSRDYYINKYCPKVKDSTRVDVIRKDTTIFTEVIDTIPADTLKYFIKVPCQDFEVTKENGRNKTTIKVVNGNLELESICKEWEYKYWVSKTISTLSEKTFHQEVRLIKNSDPKTFKNWLSYLYTWITLGLIASYISLKIYFKIKGFKLPF